MKNVMNRALAAKKKIFTLAVALLATVSSWGWEYENPGFEWSAGCEFTTTYLWRGMKNGGMAFQPDASIGYGGLNLEAWANIGSVDNSFKEFNPELDITLSYSIAGLTVGATHYFYFDGSRYFDYTKPNLADYADGNYGKGYAGNQTEVFAKYEFGEIFEKFPLTVMWATFVGGDDWLEQYDNPDDPEELTGLKRAFSSYLEVSYKAELPLGFSLTPTVGMTPWAGYYNYYENKFSVNNISLRADWELEVKEVFTLDVYALFMLNTAGINKYNVWPSISNSYNNQRLNLAAGIGIWF